MAAWGSKMVQAVISQMRRRIRAKGRGWVFTPKDFVDLGSRASVDQALQRLEASGLISPLSRGLYFFSGQEELTPPATPEHIDAIARALAAQTGDRAMLTGEEAAIRLGLTKAPFQERETYTYLTTGHSRQRVIGTCVIQLRHTAFSPPPSISDRPVQVLLALTALGRGGVNNAVKKRCRALLSKREKEQLRRLSPHAPSWMVPVLHELSSAFFEDTQEMYSKESDYEEELLLR
jgi:hypothetical protein